ncbi:MAG: hypothetical protein K2I81_04430 [Alphaproteobacteria bacterium]|nr:hypothetical protein [Alphaproteobacteria bacterium]
MKVTTRELEHMIQICDNSAITRGYGDALQMPLELRPIGGLRLLTELATGIAIWPSGDFKSVANKFINAYGAYYDAQKKLKYTHVALQALRTVTR